MPEISVIVPVYRVEPYLHKCIDSILDQSFRDFELILVDDGSPDTCGDICDSYARQDARITVIHKENGGLSSARNAGLDIALGGFIAFIDSDDYIHRDMLQLLYTNAQKSNADISVCGMYYCYPSRTVNSSKHHLDTAMDHISALRLILQGSPNGLTVNMCNKLFRRELFQQTRFPLGKTMEDAYVIVDLVLNAERVYVNTTPMYYYLQRENSICKSAFSEGDMNIVYAYEYNYGLIKKRCPQLLDMACYRLCWAHAYLIDKLMSAPADVRSRQRDLLRKGVLVIRRNLFSVIGMKEISRNFKISCLLITVHPGLYFFTRKCYNKLENKS